MEDRAEKEVETKVNKSFTQKFAFRVGFPVLIILAASIIASMFGFYAFARGQFDKLYHQGMLSAAQAISAALDVGMVKNDHEIIQQVVNDGLNQKIYTRAMILDRLGYVKVTSDPAQKKGSFSLENAACRTCHGMNPQAGFKSKMKNGVVQLPPDPKTGRSLHRSVSPILTKEKCMRCHGEKLLGFLVLDFDDKVYSSVLSASVLRFLASGAISLVVVCGVFLFFLNCNLGKPMKRLIKGIKRVGGGEFDHKLPEIGASEFVEISRQFNGMSANVKEQLEEIERKSGRIEELTRLKAEVSRMNNRLNQKVLELYMLHEIGKAVNSTLDLDLLFHIVMDMTRSALGIQDFCIFLFNEETGALEIKASYGIPDALTHEIRFMPGEGVTGEVYNSGETRMVNDTAKEPIFQFYKGAKPDIGSFLATPLVVKGKTFGVLNIDRAGANAFSSEDIELYTALANQIAIAIENARMYEITKKLSYTDALTGLYNHGFFQNRLREFLDPATKKVSLMMLDIDYFKKVNDEYGHAAGDIVLKEVSVILQQCLRQNDIVARYGGEEFAIILPDTHLQHAVIIAERIRRQVEGNDFRVPDTGNGHLQVTLSIGVSHHNGEMSPEDFMESADKALYEAKSTGRNRVVIAGNN